MAPKYGSPRRNLSELCKGSPWASVLFPRWQEVEWEMLQGHLTSLSSGSFLQALLGAMLSPSPYLELSHSQPTLSSARSWKAARETKGI